MATSTTTDAAATALEALDGKTTEYRRVFAALEEAKGRGDKKAVASLGAQLANRSAEIRNLRLDLAEEGVPTSWDPPRVTRTRQTPPMDQAELQTKLDRAAGVYRDTGVDEDLRHGADARISALLKTAAKAGYQVKDPRKAS